MTVKSWPFLNWVPLGLLAVLLINGATLGLSDDEAYYWVLAQKPSWGYAYHPPAVAWLIALSQKILGGAFGENSPIVVRFPAAISAAGMLFFSLRWLRDSSERVDLFSPHRAVLVLLSFAGIFSLAWMMVPDLPLFLGWTISFFSTWRICFRERVGIADFGMLAAGSLLAVLSKYYGILAVLSSMISILLWAPRERLRAALIWEGAGAIVALFPTVIWNHQHDWAAVLYQFRDRQSGGVSMYRYLKFLSSQLLLAGPFLFFFLPRFVSFALGASRETRIFRYSFVWFLAPALIFFIQPLFAEFKPHWALIAWWPVVLALSAWAGVEARVPYLKAHFAYGLSLIFLVWMSCHWPILGLVSGKILRSSWDPRWDVTNDLYGWTELPRSVPENAWVVGSWYQTAAQASFQLHKRARVTLVPQDLKSRDEWPKLEFAEGKASDWPSLKGTVYFVSDNRYTSAPKFKGSQCGIDSTIHYTRSGLRAKVIDVWKCVPLNEGRN